eukprot:c19011_g1_i2.p1 GENE.c19011_g1_i2~~c19011_g1_i2.p1  ORF type:complete len:756 (+),score=160.92 c19011_g1_i2:40-2268(+)
MKKGRKVSLRVSGAGAANIEQSTFDIQSKLSLSIRELDKLAEELGIRFEEEDDTDETPNLTIHNPIISATRSAHKPPTATFESSLEHQNNPPQQNALLAGQKCLKCHAGGLEVRGEYVLCPTCGVQTQLSGFPIKRLDKHEGWLRKEGGHHKNIKRRWFVLDPAANCLFYYAKPSTKDVLGVVPLLDVSVLSLGQRKMGYAFELFSVLGGEVKSSKRKGHVMAQGHHDSFVLYAETEEQMRSWMHALTTFSVRFEQVAQEEEEKRELKFAPPPCDILTALNAYVVYDEFSQGIAPRSSVTRVLQEYGVDDNVARALTKVLDFDKTQLVPFDSFYAAWRCELLPARRGDGMRCNANVHNIVMPIVHMGAHRGERGSPFAYTANFIVYYRETYGMPMRACEVIAAQLSDTNRITSIQYVRGLLQGIVPYSQASADEISELIQRFEEFTSKAPRVLRQDFTVAFNKGVVGRLSLEDCQLIFDCATIQSGGRFGLVEFALASNLGLIPKYGDTIELRQKIKRIREGFKILTGGSTDISCDDLSKYLREQPHEINTNSSINRSAPLLHMFTRAQAKVVTAALDSGASGFVTLARYWHGALLGLVPWPQEDARVASDSVSEETKKTQPPNEISLSKDILESASAFLSGEINVIQAVIDNPAKTVQLILAEWGNAELISQACRASHASYVLYSGKFGKSTDRRPTADSTVFLTILPSGVPKKEQVLYMIMKRAICNRLAAVGISVTTQV